MLFRSTIIQTTPDYNNITVKNKDVLWVKTTAIGSINLQYEVGQPAIMWNAAAWIEQEVDPYGRPQDKLDGYKGTLLTNPLIGSKANETFQVNQFYYISKRMDTPSDYFQLWEVMSKGTSAGGIDSVQCIGNILYVVYN